MRETTGRRRAVPVALLVAALLIAIVPAIAHSATAPAGLERFLYGLGQVESGGDYTARNSTSGAYGKYQIMPASWAAWAKTYLGSSTAPQTPTNQEIVAHRKVTALYTWLDSWSVTAHWWLTGSSERNSALWSSYSRSYVQKILAYMSTGDIAGSTTATSRSWIDAADVRVGESSSAIVYQSTWKTAAFASYQGGQVKYATRTGASATFTFKGNGIAWVGPVGPTRGTARVYIDGKLMATVDLRRSTFTARKVIYARALTLATHTLKIVVTSSSRPVAIDYFIVGK